MNPPHDVDAWRDLLLTDVIGFDREIAGVPIGRRTMFRGAELVGADLSRASIRHCDLTGADLSGARVSGLELSRCRLEDTGCCSMTSTGRR